MTETIDPTGAVDVHRAQPPEFATALDLINAYALEVAERTGGGCAVRESALDFSRRYLRVGAGVWLARVDGMYAGCVALQPLATPAGACELKRMYVRPEFRRRGIAAALLDAAERYAALAPYDAVFLDTRDELADAVRFYERRGYERCERYNDNLDATLFFRRSLGGS